MRIDDLIGYKSYGVIVKPILQENIVFWSVYSHYSYVSWSFVFTIQNRNIIRVLSETKTLTKTFFLFWVYTRHLLCISCLCSSLAINKTNISLLTFLQLIQVCELAISYVTAL